MPAAKSCQHDPKGCPDCRRLRRLENRRNWRNAHKHEPEFKAKWGGKKAEHARTLGGIIMRCAASAKHRGAAWAAGEKAKALILLRDSRTCMVCDAPFYVRERKHGRCLDHNHVTGEVRGVLCYRCNAGIGMLAESAERLRDVARYLGF